MFSLLKFNERFLVQNQLASQDQPWGSFSTMSYKQEDYYHFTFTFYKLFNFTLHFF